jgi:hypothetical protein
MDWLFICWHHVVVICLYLELGRPARHPSNERIKGTIWTEIILFCRRWVINLAYINMADLFLFFQLTIIYKYSTSYSALVFSSVRSLVLSLIDKQRLWQVSSEHPDSHYEVIPFLRITSSVNAGFSHHRWTRSWKWLDSLEVVGVSHLHFLNFQKPKQSTPSSMTPSKTKLNTWA